MRTQGFDKLWRWQVTDKIKLPDGQEITVTARRLNRMLKGERDEYALEKAREMNRLLKDEDSEEYKRYLKPQDTLSKEDLLKVIEVQERLHLTARARREFLSPSPSDEDGEMETLTERLNAMDELDETMRQLEEERDAWVEAQLAINMASLAEMDRERLLEVARAGIADSIINGAWWEAYSDASLKLGIYVGDKPFFSDWPTEADDDLKAKLLELYREADAASFDFSS